MVESKDVLLEVTSVFGTLLVDCIVNMAEVFDVNDDVSAFGVTEVEFTEPLVVIVSSDEML